MPNTRKFKLFYRDDCPRCPAGKELADNLLEQGYDGEKLDLDTTDGLAEGSFHSVMAVPTLILVDGLDTEKERWVGNMPNFEQFTQAVAASVV